ncbi:MAG TPA: ABC transporter permease [Longimicrobiales bacterium]
MNRVATLVVKSPVHRFLEHVGRATLLALAVLRTLPRPRRYAASMIQQAYIMGIRSLPLVLFISVLGGAVTSQQTGAQFAGALPIWVIGSVAEKTMVTELAPILTALVLIGRIGASIAAELGTMRVTEQIDALYAMGRDPVPFLVVPRVLGGIIVFPALVVLANVAGMTAAWFVGVLTVDGLTTTDFLYGVRFYFEPFDVWYSVIKGTLFGLAITFLACYIGLEGRGGAEGVGRTTTTATVVSTVAIMIIDVAVVPLLKLF